MQNKVLISNTEYTFLISSLSETMKKNLVGQINLTNKFDHEEEESFWLWMNEMEINLMVSDYPCGNLFIFIVLKYIVLTISVARVEVCV